MKRTILFFLVGLTPLAAQIAKTAPPPSVFNPPKWKIARAALTELERRFDGALNAIGSLNEPIDMLGTTRGLYLEGYGTVFTSEISLVMAPSINPFNQTISKETMTRVHQRKLERLPVLRQAMKEMVRLAATNLAQIPDNQMIVVVVRLDYLNWENTTGLPGQIMMRADRRSAVAGNVQEEVQ
jgi:hypothetical protein